MGSAVQKVLGKRKSTEDPQGSPAPAAWLLSDRLLGYNKCAQTRLQSRQGKRGSSSTCAETKRNKDPAMNSAESCSQPRLLLLTLPSCNFKNSEGSDDCAAILLQAIYIYL